MEISYIVRTEDGTERQLISERPLEKGDAVPLESGHFVVDEVEPSSLDEIRAVLIVRQA